MVRTVPREFDWSLCPRGHQSPIADHKVLIQGPDGKPKRCSCIADAQALADHPENNRSAYGVGAPGSQPRVPGPATRRDPVKPAAPKPKRKGSTKK